jgi:hypothetical protein
MARTKGLRVSKNSIFISILAIAVGATIAGFGAETVSAASVTTAWQAGAFDVDTPNLVRQADIVLGQPNTAAIQFVGLGNGTLGLAVWAANGFTAQLNRVDTLPGRKSPGWLTIPGLSAMTNAPDFSGYLDVYNATLHESGGGMTATIYLRADKDELVVDVTGANPSSTQTAAVNLWSGRSPQAAVSGSIGTLAETWVDNAPTTGSGQTFGSLAAVTAGGRNVVASVTGSTGVQVAFNPNSDGSFRVVVGAPTWTGGNAATTASTLLGSDATATSTALSAAHIAWWNSYWAGTGMVKLSSADGSAQYLEKLRTLYYYYAAAERGGSIPGSQAGLADLFNYFQDSVQWYAAAFWFWNLRMQVAANIGGGQGALLNAPVFNLYTSNLANLVSWTEANMGGLPGVCVPETMRFNGNGYQSDSNPDQTASCDENIAPTWNGMTVTTGAEIGLWIWRQYQVTKDTTFLTTNYPLMRDAAEFLLAFASKRPGGLLHTVSNAHEDQWTVQDPTNTIAAMSALFAATISAAHTLETDSALVARLQTAASELPLFARTDAATHQQLLTSASDDASTTVLGESYQPTALVHNSENDDLEPVWPYNLIGDNSALTAIAKRTYAARVNGTLSNDWSFDAVDAARLGLASEVGTDMVALTENYQAYSNGLSAWQGTPQQNPYVEQSANVALAVNESLVQDYDGLLRIAPALPSGWDVDATLPIQNKDTVSLQVHGGVIGTVAITAGSNGTVSIRNPWPGQSVNVVDGVNESTVIVAATTASQFGIRTVAGHSYLVQQVANPVSGMTVAELTDTPATAASHLGKAQIGLDPVAGRTGHITGPGGLCADDAGAITTNGNPILLWPCGSQVNQAWAIANNGEIQTLAGCMTVGTGNAVEWSACTGATSQSWTHKPNGSLVSTSGGLCLTDPSFGGAGTHLNVATCSGATTQVWTLPTGPVAIVGDGGLCADDSGAKTTNGNPIVLWTCSGAANQSWTIANNGEIQTLGGCMTVGSANAVQWATCTGATTQTWANQPNGTIVNTGSGLCLDDPAAGGAGTNLIVYACSGAANQLWKR